MKRNDMTKAAAKVAFKILSEERITKEEKSFLWSYCFRLQKSQKGKGGLT
jgi:hypothetical protein